MVIKRGIALDLRNGFHWVMEFDNFAYALILSDKYLVGIASH